MQPGERLKDSIREGTFALYIRCGLEQSMLAEIVWIPDKRK
jgi:hypothetical protein